ncbi:hypothetical protein VNO77_43113 [Canavalia gladiata]|uniref:Uncharacterized protein n=1 Tax=Canavalia gladiata TaxID=3824 RepID=A0AAN9JWH9_CANGL
MGLGQDLVSGIESLHSCSFDSYSTAFGEEFLLWIIVCTILRNLPVYVSWSMNNLIMSTLCKLWSIIVEVSFFVERAPIWDICGFPSDS